MILFFHCHKAGGTTVVDAAIQSGFQLPPAHRNGNPLDADDKPINWKTLPDDAALEKILGFKDQGVDFLCFEFSTPPWRILKKVNGLHMITVLREPLSRAFSNFRMDVLNNYIDREKVTSFKSYMNNQSLFRSDNFYTRFFSRAAPRQELGEKNFQRCIENLKLLDAVCILERNNLNEVLEPFGFKGEAFGWKNSTARKKKFVDGNAEKLGVDIWTYPETSEFHERNAFDSALYSFFLNRDVERFQKL